MRNGIILLAAVVLNAAAAAEVSVSEVRKLRKSHALDKDHQQVFYRYEDEGEYLTPADQARKRGDEAAEAWKQFDKEDKPVAVLARSPFGGSETSKGYWPAGVKGELLRKLTEPLAEQGLKVVMPDLPPEKGEGDEESGAVQEQIKPYPRIGFSLEYDFVLVVGLHHEKMPHKAAGGRGGEQAVRRFSSRVNAWAILFHSPTGAALWGTTSVARAVHGAAADALNVAAGGALSYLNFSDIGTGNITEQVKRFSQQRELPRIDLAAMLVQTQRADAVAAVTEAAISPAAFRNTVWAVRWYSNRGVVQDYRVDPEVAKTKGCVLVSQRVLMRVLLIEQLRGMRGVQACVLAANVPQMDDIEVPQIGRQFVSTLGPVCPDDEVVLTAELAHRDPYDRRGPFWRNSAGAVRNLGRCRFHIDEATAVARVFASRKPPPPRKGRRPRTDPIRQAGIAALKQLAEARAQREKEIRRKLREAREATD